MVEHLVRSGGTLGGKARMMTRLPLLCNEFAQIAEAELCCPTQPLARLGPDVRRELFRFGCISPPTPAVLRPDRHPTPPARGLAAADREVASMVFGLDWSGNTAAAIFLAKVPLHRTERTAVEVSSGLDKRALAELTDNELERMAAGGLVLRNGDEDERD